ncbi:RING-H2 finger protein ATL51-like [Helianthus annuus]|uniref:RING-H2 finger protein ATL51-like n=1 Tax=Helianthus annuus TaxID=4232 RepID=UPI000B8F11A3|nr:RING-H2 finger protein ATL51-like [Helianthus annuus]
MAELQITSNDKKLTMGEVVGGTTSAKWCSRLHSNWFSHVKSRVLNNQKDNMVTVPSQQEGGSETGDNCEAHAPILYDCVVCLCEVAPEDSGSKRLTNCEHGVQFHDGCIESWLKDHPTCPLCRSHVSRPVHLRLKAYLLKLGRDMVCYYNNALDNVATSIGECDES